MKLLLAFAFSPLKIGLLDEHNKLIATLSWHKEEAEREAVAQVIKLLSQANLTINDIDGIAIDLGPGSFTGLRMAASIALGLAYARQLEVRQFHGGLEESTWAELPVVPINNLQPIYESPPHITKLSK